MEADLKSPRTFWRVPDTPVTGPASWCHRCKPAVGLALGSRGRWPPCDAIPAFKAMVVTASVDGTDAFGFTDFAIGHFPVDVDLIVGAQQVITGPWADQAADGKGGGPICSRRHWSTPIKLTSGRIRCRPDED